MPQRPAAEDDLFPLLLPEAKLVIQRGQDAPFFSLQFDILLEQLMIGGGHRKDGFVPAAKVGAEQLGKAGHGLEQLLRIEKDLSGQQGRGQFLTGRGEVGQDPFMDQGRGLPAGLGINEDEPGISGQKIKNGCRRLLIILIEEGQEKLYAGKTMSLLKHLSKLGCLLAVPVQVGGGLMKIFQGFVGGRGPGKEDIADRQQDRFRYFLLRTLTDRIKSP